MHIPDGFVDAKTAVTAAVFGVAGLGLALRRLRASLPPAKVPRLGLAAAFVFAAQMLNFPVLGGTSGHMVGAALCAVLLGPAAAIVVMSAVVLLQALVFADGGLTALGANLFNMAVAAPLAGHGIYRATRALSPGGTVGRLAAAAFAAWCSTLVASTACAAQLAWSGTVAWPVVFPAMTAIHMAIGIGEAAVTALVVGVVARARPDWLEDRPVAAAAARTPAWSGIAYGLLLSAALAVFVAPMACPWPDGLERVAERLGFDHRAGEAGPSLLPDYTVPGVRSAVLSTAVAGAVGTAIAFALSWLAAWLMARPSPGVRTADAPVDSGSGHRSSGSP